MNYSNQVDRQKLSSELGKKADDTPIFKIGIILIRFGSSFASQFWKLFFATFVSLFLN